MLQRIAATLLLSAACFLVTLLPQQAQAACGCDLKLTACMVGKNAKMNNCTAAWRACNTKCSDKKVCLKECRKTRKSAKKQCRETFRAASCPPKGKQAKVCRRKAEKEKRECLKLAKVYCPAECKK